MGSQVFLDPRGVGMDFKPSGVFAARFMRGNFSSVFGSTLSGYSFSVVF